MLVIKLASVGEFTSRCRGVDIGEFQRRRVDQYSQKYLSAPIDFENIIYVDVVASRSYRTDPQLSDSVGSQPFLLHSLSPEDTN